MYKTHQLGLTIFAQDSLIAIIRLFNTVTVVVFCQILALQ